MKPYLYELSEKVEGVDPVRGEVLIAYQNDFLKCDMPGGFLCVGNIRPMDKVQIVYDIIMHMQFTARELFMLKVFIASDDIDDELMNI